jgi:hypothetical protein
MKRKVEKYIYTKNIEGVNKVIDSNGRYLIGHDVEGCLRAVRQPPASQIQNAQRRRGNMSVKGQPLHSTKSNTSIGVHPHTHPMSSKRPYDSVFPRSNPNFLISGVSPANNMVLENHATKKRLIPQQPSMADLSDLKNYLMTALKGGYMKGIYRSALERRRACESVIAQGNVTPETINELNLTQKERQNIPTFFQSWIPFLAPYDDPRAPPQISRQPTFSQAMSPLSRLVNGNPLSSPVSKKKQNNLKSSPPGNMLFQRCLKPSPVAAKGKDIMSTPVPNFGKKK